MLDQAIAFVNSALGQTTIVAVILEAAFRLIKTEKPLSIAHAIAAGAHKVADLVKGIATLMDKVLPQKLK